MASTTILVGTVGQGIMRSTDDGATWRRVGIGQGLHSDALVRTGDLTRPPIKLPADQTPPELSEALARHIEGSIPP